MLSDSERWQLAGFRRAAAQVRDASIIAQNRRIELHTTPGEPGYADIYVQLLGNEPFRSLALAVRLVYQQQEPSNFLSVCNVLVRYGSQEMRDRVASVRREYRSTLEDPSGSVTIGDGSEPAAYSAHEVFDNWLYGVAFHQDQHRQTAVRRLASTGVYFLWSVQQTAIDLAARVLELDDVIADFLGEPRATRA